MSNLSDVGNLMHLYLDEIDPGQGTSASEFLIVTTAHLLNQKGGRNWVPLIVKETGEDKYEVIGNSFIYAVAEYANLDKVWCIIADDSEETAELSRILAQEESPKVNLSKASRDEIHLALQFLLDQPNSPLKGVKIAIATNRIDEAPRHTWKSLNEITKLKCGITKGKKLDSLKQVFYLAPTPQAIAPGEEVEVLSSSASTGASESRASKSSDLASMAVKDLRDLAKQRGLTGYSKLSKPKLLELLQAN